MLPDFFTILYVAQFLHHLPIKIAPSDFEAQVYMLPDLLYSLSIKVAPLNFKARAYMLPDSLYPLSIKIASSDFVSSSRGHPYMYNI